MLFIRGHPTKKKDLSSFAEHIENKITIQGDKKILKVELSTKQAKDFAYSIFADIGEYIKTHQAEYDEYLKKEGLTNEK